MVGAQPPIPNGFLTGFPTGLPAGSPDRLTAVTTGMPPAAPVVPLPRRPLDPSAPTGAPGDPGERIRRWYEQVLGWQTVPPGPGRPDAPVRLRVGVCFDVLDVPAEAGGAALRHLAAGSPVALWDGRMRFLVAAGSAREVPGVLDWLEWGALPLDLTVVGEGGSMDAPTPPEPGHPATPVSGRLVEPGPPGVPPPVRGGSVGAVQGTAVWLRPPVPGGEVEASLPTLSAMGGGGGAPDLVRLLDTVATHCHRLRLRRAGARPSTVPRARR